MATDSNRESNESLYQQIQRLEKEKEELERKNRERQLLEQKLRELRGEVSSLRSGDSPIASTPQHTNSAKSPVTSSPSRGHCRDDASGGEDSEHDLDSALRESRNNLQRLQSRLFSSPPKAGPKGPKVNRRDQERASESSSDSEKGEDVMSEKHKHAIQANRDVLVNNMLPDDIFNDLVCRKILTTADVSRIREKNPVTAVNEELLDVLCRRSDRAFYVFVNSLRKTLQEHLANKIDPPSTSRSRKKRKRQTGEVNISVDCNGVEPSCSPRHSQRASHNNPRRQPGTAEREASAASCSCQEVEEQILHMAKEAYRNIRRRDATPAAFEQFRKELQQTNAIVKDSMEIMHTLKILCRHGDITGISEGSIVFTLRCHSTTNAKALWEMYTSGRLQKVIEKGFITPSLKKFCRVRKIRLKVGMVESEYLHCLQELGGEENCCSMPVPCTACSYQMSQKRRRRVENSICVLKSCRRRTIITSATICHHDITSAPLQHHHDITSATLCHHHDITSASFHHHHDITSATLQHHHDITSAALRHHHDITSAQLKHHGVAVAPLSRHSRPQPRRAFQEIHSNQSHSQNLPSSPVATSDLKPSISSSVLSSHLGMGGKQPLYNLRLRPAVVYTS